MMFLLLDLFIFIFYDNYAGKKMDVLESSLEYPRTGRFGSSHFFCFLDFHILFCTEETVSPVKEMDTSQIRKKGIVTKHPKRHQCNVLIRHIQNTAY